MNKISSWLEVGSDHTYILDFKINLFNDHKIKFYGHKPNQNEMVKLIIFIRLWLKNKWHSSINVVNKKGWVTLNIKINQRWATNHKLNKLTVSSINYDPINLKRPKFDYTLWPHRMVGDFKFRSRWHALLIENWLVQN